MIGSIKIRVHAHNPSLPLTEAVSYIGSPTAVFIYDVPRKIGSWQITDVAVSVYYPDNSFATVAAKLSAEGAWVATIPACELSGRISNGFRILASGIDEDGEPVSGYVLGVGDLAVCKLFPAPSPDPGEKAYILRYFDTAPESPKKGDVAPIDDAIKFYDGTQWVAFGSDVDLSDYYTKEETDALFDDYYTKDETDEAIDALAAYYITYNAAGAAFPTRAALLNAETYYSGGVVRTPTRNDYAVVLADETHDGAEYRYIYGVAEGEIEGQWEAQYPIETNDYTALSNKPTINNVELSGNKTGANLGLVDVAGGTMTGALAVPTIDLTQNATQEPMIRTRLANGAIQISWDNGQTYHNLYLPYVNSNVNMTTLEQVYNFVGKVAPAWSESATYAVGDIVSFMGAYYVCRMAGSTGIPATDTSHWKAEMLSNLLAAVTIPVRQPPYLADEYFPITCERSGAEVTYTQSDVRIFTNTQMGTYELRTADSANLSIAFFGSSGAFITEGIGVSNLMFAGQSPYTATLTLTPTGGTVVRSAELEDALGKKQNTLTFDDTPTAGSNNPVKSGGIKTAFDGKLAKSGDTATDITLGGTGAHTVKVEPSPTASGTTPGVEFIDPATDYTATLIIGQGGQVQLRTGNTTEGNIPKFDAQRRLVDSGKAVTDFAEVSAIRYTLGATITASATLADRTMNKVEPLATNTEDIELSFPAATNGKARDFLVLINNPTGNTGAITFDPPSGATIYGDGLEQTFAEGETWEVTVTEVATNQFLCKALKVTGKVVPWQLTFTAEQADSSVTLGTGANISLQTSIDGGETWTPYTLGTAITLANVGDSVYFAATDGVTNGRINPSTFTMTGLVAASGYISSLHNNDISTALSLPAGWEYYRGLFKGCTSLTSAPILPATTLEFQCYFEMFDGCSSLTSAPALPATTLANGCYRSMFNGCTSLTTAPELPATTLSEACYYNMLSRCASLTTPPALPATNLATRCYSHMFEWSQALVTAPHLPATETATECYDAMFFQCVSLSNISVALTDWDDDALHWWVANVKSSGTFSCPAALGDNATITRGWNNCPSGWTVVNV